MVKKEDKDIEVGYSTATKDAETVARYAPDEQTKKEAEQTLTAAQESKTEDFHGSRVERQGDGFICKEVKGTQPCGTVLKTEDELRDHLIHIHQKNLSMKQGEEKVTKK